MHGADRYEAFLPQSAVPKRQWKGIGGECGSASAAGAFCPGGSQLCKEDKAAISRCIKQLTALGYVCTEQTDTKRSYRSLLSLSDSGKELAGNVEARLQQVLSVLGEGIDERQRENLYQTLEVIMKNFASYIEAQTNTDE